MCFVRQDGVVCAEAGNGHYQSMDSITQFLELCDEMRKKLLLPILLLADHFAQPNLVDRAFGDVVRNVRRRHVRRGCGMLPME